MVAKVLYFGKYNVVNLKSLKRSRIRAKRNISVSLTSLIIDQMFNKEQRLNTITFSVLGLIALIYAIVIGPLDSPDFSAYFGGKVNVSGGYVIFLKVFRVIFGNNFEWAALIGQLLILLGSIYIFLKNVIVRSSFKSYQRILVLIALFYPIFDINIKLAANLNTGCLSYALYLIFISCYFKFLEQRQKKFYFFGVLVLLGLIFIRSQFNFVILVLLIFEIIRFIKTKKIQYQFLIAILMIPVLSGLFDRGYHKWAHKQNFKTPFTWVSLNTAMIYVSERGDAAYIEDSEIRTYFLMVQDRLDDEGLSYNDNMYGTRPEFNYSKYHFYLPVVCNQIMHSEGNTHFYNIYKDPIKAALKTEMVNKSIFFTLLPRNFSKWFGLILQSFISGLGGLAFMIFLIGIWIVLFLKWYKTKSPSVWLIFSMFLLAAIFLNRMVVAVSVHSISRYFFYHYWAVLFIFFGMMNRLEFKNQVS